MIDEGDNRASGWKHAKIIEVIETYIVDFNDEK